MHPGKVARKQEGVQGYTEGERTGRKEKGGVGKGGQQGTEGRGRGGKRGAQERGQGREGLGEGRDARETHSPRSPPQRRPRHPRTPSRGHSIISPIRSVSSVLSDAARENWCEAKRRLCPQTESTDLAGGPRPRGRGVPLAAGTPSPGPLPGLALIFLTSCSAPPPARPSPPFFLPMFSGRQRGTPFPAAPRQAGETPLAARTRNQAPKDPSPLLALRRPLAGERATSSGRGGLVHTGHGGAPDPSLRFCGVTSSRGRGHGNGRQEHPWPRRVRGSETGSPSHYHPESLLRCPRSVSAPSFSGSRKTPF